MARWFVDRSAPSTPAPSFRLRQLLPDAEILGATDPVANGLSTDHATLRPGQAFVPLRDRRARPAVDLPGDESGEPNAIMGEIRPSDATSELDEALARAIERGASCVVVERPELAQGRPRAVVPDAHAAFARLCHALAGDPAEHLAVLGVAGGDEGSPVTPYLRSIFERAGRRYGAVGHRGWTDGLATMPTGPGYPDPEGLASMLAAMQRRRCVGAIVEVAGPGVEGAPLVDGVRFAGAILTEIHSASGDARDDDPDARRARRRAYGRLARRVRPGGFVVVDGDDPDSEILGATNLGADRIAIGIGPDSSADLRAEIERSDRSGSTIRLVGLGMDRTLTLRLPGESAIRHALAAAAAASARGVEVEAIVAGLEAVASPADPADPVDEGQAFAVVIDPASTAPAVARSLAGLRASGAERIIVVIGAQGHGDPASRRALAEAAEGGADLVVFTSDNPRGEDPRRIVADLLGGIRRPDKAIIEPDRRRAIEAAVAVARPGDAVLVAGKGRRGFQILGDRVVPFDDRAVAARAIRASTDPVRTVLAWGRASA